MFESDIQHRQPLGPLRWVRLALVAAVKAFSVKPEAKVEPKWKHRPFGRSKRLRNVLI
jgi:hypothetical protein